MVHKTIKPDISRSENCQAADRWLFQYQAGRQHARYSLRSSTGLNTLKAKCLVLLAAKATDLLVWLCPNFGMRSPHLCEALLL